MYFRFYGCRHVCIQQSGIGDAKKSYTQRVPPSPDRGRSMLSVNPSLFLTIHSSQLCCRRRVRSHLTDCDIRRSRPKRTSKRQPGRNNRRDRGARLTCSSIISTTVVKHPQLVQPRRQIGFREARSSAMNDFLRRAPRLSSGSEHVIDPHIDPYR